MKYRQLPYSRSNETLSSSQDSTSTITGKRNQVDRIIKINMTTSRLGCHSRSLKSLTIRSGSKRSDGLRLLLIVKFQTTLVLSPVPFQRTVLVNTQYQFLQKQNSATNRKLAKQSELIQGSRHQLHYLMGLLLRIPIFFVRTKRS